MERKGSLRGHPRGKQEADPNEQASRAADPKSAWPAFAQVIGKAPGAPRAAPNLGPDSPPQTPLTCLHGPVGTPESRAERLPSAGGGAPSPPKELIPVAGGGGAEGRSRRRRKGREVSAAIPARELARGRPEKGGKGGSPRRGAVPPERGPGRGGWPRWEGTRRQGPRSGGRSQRTGARRAGGGTRTSAATCPRTAPAAPSPGREKLGRTFKGRESQSGRKCERPREEGGRGLASGRGRSRRRRPRLPHPRARLGGAGGARGARRGRGGMRRDARARARGRRGAARAGEPRLPSPGRASLGTSQRWNPRNAELPELLLQAREKSRTFINVVALGEGFQRIAPPSRRRHWEETSLAFSEVELMRRSWEAWCTEVHWIAELDMTG
ncbi:unnamed protein product [Rangifer tarandus platyrhynchus]|uniref:Uncharacterized protein n=1 Tax=Rangifer tarandus platyrhynchus TaxID=3082113 RepID=A0ABN9A1F1_RANTA|nr:unnamed protein product [Rangifer tarandus platyrhynchus]